MGGKSSKNKAKAKASHGSTSSAAPAPADAAPQEQKKLDPQDFACKNVDGQVFVKLPGSVNGQQFIIRDCKDSDIFICDHSTCVTIDNCTNCRIFMGPIDGRTCVNCKLVIACQQWRTRNCKDCDILLFCDTQPTIEASKNMRFGCFQAYYPGLIEQFPKANLNIFQNEWSNIFDFTQADGNWSFLPPETTIEQLLKPFPPEVLGGEDPAAAPMVVPLTWGNRILKKSNAIAQLFIIVGCKDARSSLAFLGALQKSGAVLIDVRKQKFNKQSAGKMLQGIPDTKQLMSQLTSQDSLGIRVSGEASFLNSAASLCSEWSTKEGQFSWVSPADNPDAVTQIANAYSGGSQDSMGSMTL